MQDPTPKTTNPETLISESRCGSAEEVSASKLKTATSDLEAPLLTGTSFPSRSTVPLDQDQVPDEQAETQEEIPINHVAATDQRPPVVYPMEAPQRHAPVPPTNAPAPPAYAPTQNNPLDELVAGVESLQVQDPHALQVEYEVVLRRDFDHTHSHRQCTQKYVDINSSTICSGCDSQWCPGGIHQHSLS
ncbi:hypothetical protein BJ741DRAFT_601134 [Chytriomyces cf. hyalinus JEL632]|nr:hypothetical protein BJ741DRAFT_601134 [Chytriomyces cf. hyalinus JEL632]